MEHTFLEYIGLTCGAFAAYVVKQRRLTEPKPKEYVEPAAKAAVDSAAFRARGPEDALFLNGNAPGARDLLAYLGACRKDFQLIYLRQARKEFLVASRELRTLAGAADAPDRALTALRYSIRFHALWLLLRLSLTFPFLAPAWRRVESLFGTRPEPARESRQTSETLS